jgi:hypothetical protein
MQHPTSNALSGDRPLTDLTVEQKRGGMAIVYECTAFYAAPSHSVCILSCHSLIWRCWDSVVGAAVVLT